jgi:hypothetical protein
MSLERVAVRRDRRLIEMLLLDPAAELGAIDHVITSSGGGRHDSDVAGDPARPCTRIQSARPQDPRRGEEGAMISDVTVLRRNPRVESRGLGEEGGAVLLHLGTGAYHGTNDVGAVIWEVLAEPMSFGALLDQVRAKMEDTPPTLEDEIRQFLQELVERDLVLVGDAGEPGQAESD